MQCSIADANSIPVCQSVRLMRHQAQRVHDARDDRSTVRRSQVLNQEIAAFAPDPGVPARDLRLRVKSREIDLRKYIGQRIAAS